MRSELEQELYDRYPDIFVKRTLPMSQTCMCWGICTGDGWFELIDSLCNQLTHYCKLADILVPEASQVKEKFGALCFYYNVLNASDLDHQIIDAIISKAEHMSEHTCEVCGEYGEQNVRGWIKTSCVDHEDAADKIDAARFSEYERLYRWSSWSGGATMVWFAKIGHVVDSVLHWFKWLPVRLKRRLNLD